MFERVITGSLLIVATIHVLPAIGFFSGDRLAALYDIDLIDPNLEILMRHRAILFAIVGGFIAVAAFKAELRIAAFIIASVSIVSFLYLSITVGDYNAAIRKVVIADVIAAGFLLAAIIAHMAKR